MKKFIIILFSSCLLFGSCNEWLDILPKNEQVTENYWQTKEDVEQILASAYHYMHETTDLLVYWGELRGGSMYSQYLVEGAKLQNFVLLPSSSYCTWAPFYQVISLANSVLDYADIAQQNDDTYSVEAMRSHKTEAYFMRSLMYFYLVRNFKEVPLILNAYVDDSAPYKVAKSTEEQILEQIKTDLKRAIDSGAAKEFFEHNNWKGATKGRATRWAIYALMADVCLWSEDYDGCIEYADLLLNTTSPYRPAFMTDGNQWFSIFEIGNSNESIFELNWDASMEQTSNNPSQWMSATIASPLRFTPAMVERLVADRIQAENSGNVPMRGEYSNYFLIDDLGLSWKYIGTSVAETYRTGGDANLIIYRMAEILLMKAEAYIWKGDSTWQEALDLINQVRARVHVPLLAPALSEETEESMLKYVLHERDMELAGELKRWYDLVRYGKSQGYRYKADFITMILENNATANPSWLRSVLKNEYAWYLPVNQSELDVNELLEQNPYYTTTQ